jgi:small subunit ribosomal protein S1
VTCEVIEVKDGGLEVKIVGTDLTAFIKRNELARDRGDQRPERFSYCAIAPSPERLRGP